MDEESSIVKLLSLAASASVAVLSCVASLGHAQDKAAAILSNPAGHYFNVHTALNAAGAIRGQLVGPVTP